MGEAHPVTRHWTAWELADTKPDAIYQPILAATLGTATAALFPPTG